MKVAGFAMAMLGAALMMVAALGLFRLPDALSRQHAATKSTTLALGMILVGAALHAGVEGWWWRVLAMLLLLVATLPVASHMLARAAARHAYTADSLRDAPLLDGDGPVTVRPRVTDEGPGSGSRVRQGPGSDRG